MATTAGLLINCANSALYMANYNLLVRWRTAGRRGSHPFRLPLQDTLHVDIAIGIRELPGSI